MPSPELPCPDLMCAAPRTRIDVATLRQTLVFAFAAGGTQEAFDESVATAQTVDSSWQRAGFARDLYIDELADRCFAVRIDGKAHRTCVRYLVRTLVAPPSDERDVETRRGVLAELAASPSRRSELERAYLAIVRLRTLLCAARQPAPRVRRIEILRAAREVFDLLAASFEGATSPLTRLRAFGVAVVEGEGYRRLVELLEHEEHKSSLDLRVRVGADGEVRSMQIVAIHENRTNSFYPTLLRRIAVRLSLFLRGYRTTAGEIAERLLSDVFAGIEEATALLFQLLGDIEIILGSLGFRDRAREKGLAVCLPTLVTPRESLALAGLFNPLLLAAGVSPTPCDVRASARAIVIVTGPNSGGKTRLLQSIALAQLLAQAGLFAPVREAILPRASGLFASLFEDARADQPEGHLGMELLRIRRLFDELDQDALVVLDELCSGTNPSEGEKIAHLVLSLLPELGVRGFITTHLLQFASGLTHDPCNAALEFLQVELDAQEQPTYRFVPGVARTSLAHKTAARLGVTREELLERIAAKRRGRQG